MTEALALHAAEEILEAVRTSRHASYPAYKPSGVEWLGDVPEHWDVKQLKRSVLSRKGGVWGEEPNDEDTGIVCVRVADFDRTNLRVRIENPTFRSIPNNELKGRLLEKGDLLLEKSGGGEKQLVGAVMLFDHDVRAVNSNFVARMTPASDYDSRYLAYLHSWLYSSRINFRSIKQTTGIQNLDSDAYLSEKVAFPPLEEQQAIARFLDEQTRKIDDLIEAKRSLLDLLKEKRQAVITHAVTRGLDPAAKLKPSGVEWLGDVPEHWDVKRLKHLGHIRYGLGEPPEYSDDGLPFIRATDIYRGKINVNEVRRVDPSDVPWSRNPQLQEKDILVVRSGAYTGDSAIVTKDIAGSIAGYDMVMSVTEAGPEYIAYSLLGKHLLEGQIYLSKLRAAQPHLNAEELGNCLVAIPSEAEQSDIVDQVREETQKIEDLESVVREAIVTLELLRTSIISAAITGKIDVRGEGA